MFSLRKLWLFGVFAVSLSGPVFSAVRNYPPGPGKPRFGGFDREKAAALHRTSIRVVDFITKRYIDLKLDPLGQNVSRACTDDVNSVIAGVRNGDSWAVRFIDAFGKPEAGILEGNTAWLGSFQECVGIETHTNNSASLRGKYCLATVGQSPSMHSASLGAGNEQGAKLALNVGLCFPDSCTDADALQILNNVLAAIPQNLNISLQVQGTVCQPRTQHYDSKAIVAFFITGVFGFLVAAGTLYDVILCRPATRKQGSSGTTAVSVISSASGSDVKVCSPRKDGAPVAVGTDRRLEQAAEDERRVAVTNRHGFLDRAGVLGDVLVAFSLYGNGKKILSTTQSEQSLTCIHGIRFLSMTWVILGHTYTAFIFIVRDIAVLPDVISNFWLQAVLNATVSVDTFFAMSGLLVSYLFVLNYEKEKKFPILAYYIHRYWRLTAVYAVILGIYVSLFKYIGSGPLWKPDGWEIDSCRTTWWTNFLYINNMVYPTTECMNWTWYLSNDMQFYWISPLILLPLVKKPVLGLSIIGFLFAAHIVATGTLSAKYQFKASFADASQQSEAATENYTRLYYMAPWARIGPYLVGMLFGFLLAKYRRQDQRLPKRAVSVLWLVAAVAATAVLYGLWDSNSGHPLSPESNAAYLTLHRSAWGLAVCWVIFACVNGYGGWVNTLLSWKALIPLSRLTYCCYLIHPPVILAFYLSRTTTSDFSHAQAVYYFFGSLVISYSLAFVFTICCESPLMSLEKITQNRIRNAKTRKQRSEIA